MSDTNETAMPANTRVRYTDGHTDEIMVTMFQRAAAETYGKAHCWGSLMAAAVKLATVVSIEDINNDADADMFGTPVAASVDDGEEEPDFGPFPAGTRTA